MNSFRSLYDVASPIVSCNGPVTLTQLLFHSRHAPTTDLAKRLTSLHIHGHSMPLFCPPLIVTAASSLTSFTMTGHALGSSRHYSLSSINNFHHNFLAPSRHYSLSSINNFHHNFLA